MSARLDKITNYGDYHGGVSDPRLVKSLGNIPSIDPRDELRVRNMIARAFPTDHPHDFTARATLLAMLFDEDATVTANAIEEPPC